MKLKSLFNVVLFIVLPYAIFAQVEDTIRFKNYKPNWVHYVQPEGFEYESLSVGTTPSPIFDGNKMYYYGNIWNSSPFQGFVSERIDVETGNLDWSTTFYFDSLNTREMASDHRIVDGLYSVLINKEARTPDIFGGNLFFWSNSVLGERKLDTSDGSLVESYLTDSTDANNLMVQIPKGFLGTSTIYSRNKESTLGVNYSGFSCSITTINKLGYHLDTIQFENDVPSGFTLNLSNVKSIADEKFMGICHFTKSDSIGTILESKVILNVFNKDLSYLTEVDITDKMPSNQHYINFLSYDDGGLILKTRENVFNVEQPITILHFDYAGNLKEKVVYDNHLFGVFSAKALPNGSGMVVYRTITEDHNDYNVIELFKTNGQGEVTRSRSLTVDMKEHYAWLGDVIFSPNNDVILLFVQYRKDELNIDDKQRDRSYLHFDPGFLDLSDVKKSPDIGSIELYPNPCQDELHIGLKRQKGKVSVLIYDNLGHLVKDEVVDLGTSHIDMQGLVEGIYYVVINDGLHATIYKGSILVQR